MGVIPVQGWERKRINEKEQNYSPMQPEDRPIGRETAVHGWVPRKMDSEKDGIEGGSKILEL